MPDGICDMIVNNRNNGVKAFLVEALSCIYVLTISTMKTNRTIWYLLLLLACCGCSDDDSGVNIKHSNPDVPKPASICSMNIFPANGWSVPENSNIYLSWRETTDASFYDVYLGQGDDIPVLIASNLSTTSFEFAVPPGIDISYRWYVRSKKSNGDYTDCPQKTTSFITKELPPLAEQQKIVNVLVLSYDPIIGGERTFREYYHWQDPKKLAEEYMSDILKSSHNLIKYNIVEWRDIHAFPAKADGFVYTPATYRAVMANPDSHHSPDDADYYGIIKEQRIAEGINENVFEEVWIFGAPYFGFWESAMAGRKAFYINGNIFSDVGTSKAFVMMGFSYERDVAEMLHNLCHRSEATLSIAFSGWNAGAFRNSWERFAANVTQSHGEAVAGSCHYPPNALADYDYDNPTIVMSSADDWINYPILTGYKKQVNSDTWGGPNHERNYLNWWYSHLPHREGVAPDNKLNNWWRYIFEFNETVIW
jgi:hypothetical protein